jgi:hypothetical protein
MTTKVRTPPLVEVGMEDLSCNRAIYFTGCYWVVLVFLGTDESSGGPADIPGGTSTTGNMKYCRMDIEHASQKQDPKIQ